MKPLHSNLVFKPACSGHIAVSLADFCFCKAGVFLGGGELRQKVTNLRVQVHRRTTEEVNGAILSRKSKYPNDGKRSLNFAILERRSNLALKMQASFSSFARITRGFWEEKSEVIHVPGINDRLHLYLSFQWAELRGPEPRHEGERDEDIRRISPHYHFKCSASEADEGGRKNKGGERGREGGKGVGGRKKARVGFRVQRHGSRN